MPFQIIQGKQNRPIRCVIYGVEGIGKTTLANKLPDPIIIDLEDGSGQLDAKRIDCGKDYQTLKAGLDFIAAQNTKLAKTVVIDTADRLEQMMISDLLKRERTSTLERLGGGFGKGYAMLADEFSKEIIGRLDRILNGGMNIVVICHSQIRKVERPDLPAFDHYEMKLNKKVAPLLKEWCDMLLFANYQFDVQTGTNGNGKATGKARRMLYTTHAPTYDAKNRYGLPESMSLDHLDSLEELFSRNSGNTVMVADKNDNRSTYDKFFSALKKNDLDPGAVQAWLINNHRMGPDQKLSDLKPDYIDKLLQNMSTLKSILV